MRIRNIQPTDNEAIAKIIRQVMTEFGACGEGFSIMDEEVDKMYENYSSPRAAYFVIEENNSVLGGGGIAPLAGADESICELKKMYFLPSLRGKGAGKLLMQKCLEEAKSKGYKTCYIETIPNMTAANQLYISFGFKKISHQLGATGHHGCESFYVLDLV